MRRLEDLPDAPPDDLGLPEMAFLLADTVLVFDHLKHTITVVANAFVEGRDVDGPYERAVARIADVKQKLLAPLPASAYGLAEADEVEPEAAEMRPQERGQGRRRRPAARHVVHDPRAVREAASPASASTSTPATPFRSCSASVSARRSTCRRLRSTVG